MPTYTANIDRKIIEHYFKAQWENTANHRPVLQALMKRGNVERGISGKALVWNARVARYATTTYAIGQAITITEKRQTIQASLPWAFLSMTDAVTFEEIQMATGAEALQKRHAEICKNMYRDFEAALNSQVLSTDGATASGSPIHGLPTFLALSKFTFTGADGTPASSHTYAGHSIALNGLANVDNADSDAWTPRAVDATHSSIGGWSSGCLRAIQRLVTQLTFGNKEEEQPDLLITTRSDFVALKSKIVESQRIMFASAPNNAPQGLGIPGAIVVDGIECLFDADMPANTAYLLNSRQAWLEVLPKPSVDNVGPSLPNRGGSDIFDVRTQEDIRTNGVSVRCNWAGQFRFNPRYHGVIKTA